MVAASAACRAQQDSLLNLDRNLAELLLLSKQSGD